MIEGNYIGIGNQEFDMKANIQRFYHTGLPGRLSHIAVVTALAGALLAASAHADTDEFSVSPGLSAHWYDSDRSGEGLVLEILDENTAVIYWFTYDESGNQRWLTDVGDIEGKEIVFPELTVTSGGRFGPEFDPAEVETQVVGDAVLSFSDCDTAQWSYSAFGHSEALEMTRLTQTMAAGCQPINGVPGQPIMEYAGQSGSWYDPSHVGEGYTLHWLSNNRAVLIWFTYDSEGEQYWMTGVGEKEGDQIVFPSLESTRGPVFGPDYDADQIGSVDWGQLVLGLDCDDGVAVYESNIAGFGSGELDLVRLSSLSQPNCPWQQPKLTDLYEIELMTIYEGDERIDAQSITSDGVIVGELNGDSGRRAVLWQGLEGDWEELAGEVASRPKIISSDGRRILGNERPNSEEGSDPMLWKEETGWQPFSDLIFDKSMYFGASQDISHVVGIGGVFGDPGRDPWVWTESEGQVALPESEDIPGSKTPFGVANDGSAVVGTAILGNSSGPIPSRRAAIRWQGGNEPFYMLDEYGSLLGSAGTCNEDCSIVFGTEQGMFEPEHPHFREAWYWLESGESGYLGQVEDAVTDATVAPATPLNTTADGTMIVGSYPTFTSFGRPGTRAFFWTVNTGMVSIRTIFEDLQIGDDDWEFMRASSISPDGNLILLSGYAQEGEFATGRIISRIQVLRLSEK